MAEQRMTYRDHALHILHTLGFTGEEAEIQAVALATYLEVYVAGKQATALRVETEAGR